MTCCVLAYRRQSAGCDRAAFCASRLAHHDQFAQLFPGVDDPEINCMLVERRKWRGTSKAARSMPNHGPRLVFETGADVAEIGELLYSKQSLAPVRWVLAVPEDGPIQSVKDLEGK